MWYTRKKKDAVCTQRNRGIYLLVAVIFLLALASFTAAQTVDDDTIKIGPAAPPANDNFKSPQVLSGTQGSANGTTIDATKEPGEPSHAGNAGGHSVWYSWTHTFPAPLGISFSLRSANTNFDTLLAVYTGSQVNALV